MSNAENNQNVVIMEHLPKESTPPVFEGLSQTGTAINEIVATAAIAKKIGNMARSFENSSRSKSFFIMGFLIGVIIAVVLAQYWIFFYYLAPFFSLFFALLAKELEFLFQTPERKQINNIATETERLKNELNEFPNNSPVRGAYEQSITELLEKRKLLILKEPKSRLSK